MKKIIFLIFVLTFLFSGALSFSGELPDSKTKEYRITVGDTLEITVYQETDLTGPFEVKKGGTITYPFLGQVYVENLTKREIEQKISGLLEKDYLVNPGVCVTITSYNMRRVLLLGHVKEPGTYDFPESRNLTLLELITEAGGFTGYAAIKGTKIVRSSDDGKKIVINPRINEIIKGRKQDVELEAGDLIIVPERLF